MTVRDVTSQYTADWEKCSVQPAQPFATDIRDKQRNLPNLSSAIPK